MTPDPLAHGPAAADSPRWRTLSPQRTVLAIARTLTSAIRLLEAIVVFRADPRVQIVFTVDPGSRYSAGVDALLRELDTRLVPWSQIPALHCDLVLAASENAGFEQVGEAPILVLPHGIGFHKYVPDGDRGGTRLSGLADPELVRTKQISHLITHPDQETQLRHACPDTAGRVLLGGDLSLDGLLAGSALRPHYRERLGVLPAQRLVVFSSTWGPQSAFGRFPKLPDRLLAELDATQTRVAMILHPNAFTWHGHWQLAEWLDDALRAGLILIPPTAGWHATMIAADVVVGDHGSVTLYGAVIDKPILLAAFGSEVVPDTPLAWFGRLAQRLDHRAGLPEQLDKAIATQQPGQFRHLADQLFSRPGEAAASLRGICYRLLNLPEPHAEIELAAVPAPVTDQRPVHSFDVRGELVAPRTVSLHRFPAAVREHRPPSPPEALEFLVVGTGERHLRLYANASVIVSPDPESPADLLHRHPGCTLTEVSTVDGWLIAIRDRGEFLMSPGTVDPVLAASAVHLLWCTGQLEPGPLVVRDGSGEHHLTLTAR
ncbi:hypothetical protein [Crossiella cryophila]|uniref:Uncharacterized protein n=1 Tax=Crossiella cryophila TaxID=43355 RepID=A0A7W7CEH0_9PSEU|nr:hypothetical protein [Crossiella cryophila]MBB4678406.1 hypothetical protein [Crossiella cryophila]